MSHLGEIRLLVGTAWVHARADLLRSLLQSVAALAMGTLPWWVALVVSGMERRDQFQIIAGMSAIALSVFSAWVLRGLGATAHVSMAEKVAFAFERRLAQMTATLPSTSHHDDPEFADQLQILHQNQGRLGGGMSGLIQAVDVIVNAVILVAVAAFIEPRLLLLTIAVVPAVLAGKVRLAWHQAAEEASAPEGRRSRHLRSVCLDRDYGMELRVFALRRGIIDRLGKSLRRWQAPRLSSARRGATLGVYEDIVTVVLIPGVTLCWLLYLLAQGTIGTPVVVAAAIAARQIQQGLVQVVYAFERIADTLQFVQRFQTISDYWHAQQRPKVEVSEIGPGIRLSDVSFKYPNSEGWALRHIDLAIPRGRVVAIVGENGAGKSTLVQILLGLLSPTCGELRIADVDVTLSDPAGWQGLTSATFQDFTRPELRAFEAIGLGEPPVIDDRTRTSSAADLARVGDSIRALPEGFDTQLGASWPGGADLSGGQWQRVALARGMMRPMAQIIALDEPTAALDAHAENEIFEAYAARAEASPERGAITLLVTHRFSTVRSADWVIVLNDGRIEAQGTHATLITSGGRYAELYAIQARGYLS